MNDWHEQIKTGILCWVWDDNEGCKFLRVVNGYDEEEEVFKYTSDYCGWMNAKPAHLDEVEKYFLEGKVKWHR